MKMNLLKSKGCYAFVLLAVTSIAISCKKNSNNNVELDAAKKSTAITKAELSAIARAGFSPFTAYKTDGGYMVEGVSFKHPSKLG